MARRRGFDNQGRPIDEVASSTGTFRTVLDTARLRELKVDELSLEDTRPMQRPHFSPYDTLVEVPATVSRKRSSLGYLRAISEGFSRRRKG